MNVIAPEERSFLFEFAARFPRNALAAHPCVFDVGANVGEYTAAVLNVMPGAEVWAFEPQAAALDAYRDRHRGACSWLVGLSSRRGRAELRTSEDAACVQATLYDRPDAGDYHGSGIALSQREPIILETLDYFVRDVFAPKCGVRRINLLKLDVEGHEYDVLVGGHTTLRERVDVVQFEFNDCADVAGVAFEDICHALSSAGFGQPFKLQLGGAPVATRAEDLAPDENSNFVSVHRDCQWFTGSWFL